MKRTNTRAGVTLVELMVVATLVLMIMAISVPTLKPMLQSQGTNNASMVVSTYLNRARTRAMVTGRPCGVRFETWQGTLASVLMRQIEVPPLFTGYYENSNVSVYTLSQCCGASAGYNVQYLANSNWFTRMDSTINSLKTDSYFQNVPEVKNWVGTTTAAWAVKLNSEYRFLYFDSGTIGAIKSGNRIQLDGMGPFYDVVGTTSIKNLVSNVINDYVIIKGMPGTIFPNKIACSFQMQLQEVPTMTAPVGLPEGTVLDLTYSGIGSGFLETTGDATTDTCSVTVLFTPAGEVKSFTYQRSHLNSSNTMVDNVARFIPADTIYFLIGKWDKLDLVRLPSDPVANYADGSNFWVTINPTTGLVSTTPVNSLVQVNPNDDTEAQIINSREFARQLKRNLGGL